jgi:hypothetical protein
LAAPVAVQSAFVWRDEELGAPFRFGVVFGTCLLTFLTLAVVNVRTLSNKSVPAPTDYLAHQPTYRLEGYVGLNLVVLTLSGLIAGFFVPVLGLIVAGTFSAISVAIAAEMVLIRRLESLKQRSYWELGPRSTRPITFFFYPMGAPEPPWIFYDRLPGKMTESSVSG